MRVLPQDCIQVCFRFLSLAGSNAQLAEPEIGFQLFLRVAEQQRLKVADGFRYAQFLYQFYAFINSS
jgi:hypothetical protein